MNMFGKKEEIKEISKVSTWNDEELKQYIIGRFDYENEATQGTNGFGSDNIDKAKHPWKGMNVDVFINELVKEAVFSMRDRDSICKRYNELHTKIRPLEKENENLKKLLEDNKETISFLQEKAKVAESISDDIVSLVDKKLANLSVNLNLSGK